MRFCSVNDEISMWRGLSDLDWRENTVTGIMKSCKIRWRCGFLSAQCSVSLPVPNARDAIVAHCDRVLCQNEALICGARQNRKENIRVGIRCVKLCHHPTRVYGDFNAVAPVCAIDKS